MSNFFEEVLDDVHGVEEKILGPDYDYWKQIKSPSQLGMSTKGSLSAIGKDVDGLINYVDLLVSGGGSASKTNGPMGNKFFLKTAATCKDKASSEVVDRYIYINNVPDGTIPFISGAMGSNSSNLEGLIPGTIGNIAALNPMLIFQAFMSGSQPECQEITLETIDSHNNKGTESRHVTTVDLKNMNPCDFEPVLDKNPISGKSCREGFANIKRGQIPDDFLVKTFYASMGMFGVYLLFCIMVKIKERK